MFKSKWNRFQLAVICVLVLMALSPVTCGPAMLTFDRVSRGLSILAVGIGVFLLFDDFSPRV